MVSKKKQNVAGVSCKAEKEADLVMGTNNSSIVSKRSVEMFYYPQPHFFRYFVKKPQRRAPLINRGYWLRMYAMIESVRRFMKEPSDKPKFVLNLGCGFDPLPFMLLSADKSLCSNVQFVDIDYEKLMVNKKAAIQRTKEITDLLEDVEFLSDEKAIQISSKNYLAIGCDLKNLKKLDDTLKNEVLPADCSILCLAEVSLTYMDVQSANAAIAWASKLCDEVQFCILEQFFPDGPEHPFASTMMKHFKKLGAPLYSIHEYPSLEEQEQRFKNAGWEHANARSLWELWSDDEFLSSSVRASLDAVESFDEWEEFALFASHYFLLHASTRNLAATGNPRGTTREETTQSNASDKYMLLPHCPPGGDQRRFGALVPDEDGSLGHHGGLGRQTRLASTSLYSQSQETTKPSHPFPSKEVPARMCHTVTTLSDNGCLLVGGRTSPAGGLQDCWLRRKAHWQQIQPLPEPRYRHSAAKVTLYGSTESVLIYGGKSSDGKLPDTWLLWKSSGSKWQAVQTRGTEPCVRFGACMVSMDDTTGVLFGGIGKDNVILEDFWTWTLCEQDDGTLSLEFVDITEKIQGSSQLYKYVSRFGATVNQVAGNLIIAGGIIPRQIVPADKEIMLLEVKNNAISAIGLGREFPGPRPLLCGHVSCVVHPNHVLILGGGAVCFSFGTFWTEGTWLLKPVDSSLENKWTLVPENVQSEDKSKVLPSSSTDGSLQKVEGIQKVPKTQIDDPEKFQQVLRDGKPVVIEGSDIGSCTHLWTKEYMADAVGSERKVVVHQAESEHMSFQSKNFSYTTKEFGDFLDDVHAGGRQYLRSISADQPSKLPANLAVDFPNLHNDFRLPPSLSFVKENAHSSPLRISGPVTLWLHYDVMANVLCQVRGERRLVLFPPTDVQHLQIPPGASSSTVDVFKSLDGSIACPAGTSPWEAVLQPGHILYIPPLWLHTASPSPAGQVSVAVNVFFRNLATGYAAGRDVYGNRDLQAYEKGRSDVQKIARSFEGVPSDMARFYMLRLAQELKDHAGV